MVRIALKIKANLENVTNLRPTGPDFKWWLKIKCTNCNEESDKWHYLTLEETHEVKGSRGTAHFILKCKLCSNASHMTILRETITPYNNEDSLKFKRFVVFDCRGVEPVDFEPREGFSVDGLESGTPFVNIKFTEDQEWADYDEKAQEPVSISEFECTFERE